jgi:lysophospholipase L1-like esterase
MRKIRASFVAELRDFKTMAIIGRCGVYDTWDGGTFVGSYVFTYGGGTPFKISMFDVSVLNNPLVCFVGDSITEGYGATPPSMCWSQKLCKMLKDAVISAQSSDSVSAVVNRFDSEYDKIKPKIIFATIGTNETSSPQNLYDTLISRANAIGAAVVLNYIPTGYDLPDKFAIIRSKNLPGVHFEQISLNSQGQVITSLFPDGIHPNNEASEMMKDRCLAEVSSIFITK